MKRALVFVGAVAVGACNGVLGVNEPIVDEPEIVDRDEPGSSSSGGDGGGGGGTGGETGNRRPQGICGDGVVQDGEECDDENEVEGDGCHHCMKCGPAPELVDPVNRLCYRLAGDDGKRDWAAAQEECEAWGGTLAAVTSTDEYAFVQNHIRDATWIGAHRDGAKFVWVTGESFDFAPWSTRDEPPGEGCVEITAELTGFALRDCAEPLRYLCERTVASK
jgi:cysteine-rich repeat protein